MNFLRATWQRWTQFAHAVGVVQTRGLMILIYAFVAVPTGILMKFRGDPLRLKHPKDGNWVSHVHQEQSLEAARRQF